MYVLKSVCHEEPQVNSNSQRHLSARGYWHSFAKQTCCLGKFVTCRKQGVRRGRETVEALKYAKSGHVAPRVKTNGPYLSRAITSMGSQRHGEIAHVTGVVP